jgi:hypothetical protein
MAPSLVRGIFPPFAQRLPRPGDGELGCALPTPGKTDGEIRVVRPMHTESTNHDPAITLVNTVSVRLGTDNQNVPVDMVLM